MFIIKPYLQENPDSVFVSSLGKPYQVKIIDLKWKDIVMNKVKSTNFQHINKDIVHCNVLWKYVIFQARYLELSSQGNN